ncbi:hypothetical protein CHN66_03080 [Listeria monocytogenes]|nr:hypothetical protein [Listeria monocytogenes]
MYKKKKNWLVKGLFFFKLSVRKSIAKCYCINVQQQYKFLKKIIIY